MEKQEQGLIMTPVTLQELLKTVVEAARKPNEYEQKKIDVEQAREKVRLAQKKQMSEAEVARREGIKRNCPHGTAHPGNGTFKHTWRAAVLTPAGEKPYFLPMCEQCQTQLDKIYATPEQVREGVELHKYQGLTVEYLERWSRESRKVNEKEAVAV